MTQKKVERQTGRKRYSAEFKQQALLRAVKDGCQWQRVTWGWKRRSSMRGTRKRATRARCRGPAPDAIPAAPSTLDTRVRDAFEAQRARAGAPRLARHLGKGRRHVAESLRRQSLRAKAAKKFKATTNSNHSLPVVKNLLQQNFTASQPNHVWVADIPYIATDEGWLYLAVVLDLYSRKVVGWSTSARMTATLVGDALRMALFARKMPRGVIMHTDRGRQSCSREHRKLLDEHGLVASMSARSNCYDNAALESWKHSLKVEAIHGEKVATREVAMAHVFEYIGVDYNRTRLHSTPGYLSPEQFELAHAA